MKLYFNKSFISETKKSTGAKASVLFLNLLFD